MTVAHQLVQFDREFGRACVLQGSHCVGGLWRVGTCVFFGFQDRFQVAVTGGCFVVCWILA